VDEERAARVGLVTAGPSTEEIRRAVAREGPEAVWARERAAASELDLAGMLDLYARGGWRVLIPGDREWPRSLAAAGSAAPLALWVHGQGDLAEAAERAVAVTGGRVPSRAGRRTVRTLAGEMAQAGWTVLTLLMPGVSLAALDAAWWAQGPAPVAVGTHSVEEARLEYWPGLRVSAVPPGPPGGRRSRLAHSHLLVAMAAGTVLVEPAHEPTALAMAARARRLDRPLMAVPGPSSSSRHRLASRLLRDGHAHPVTDARDITRRLPAPPVSGPAGHLA